MMSFPVDTAPEKFSQSVWQPSVFLDDLDLLTASRPTTTSLALVNASQPMKIGHRWPFRGQSVGVTSRFFAGPWINLPAAIFGIYIVANPRAIAAAGRRGSFKRGAARLILTDHGKLYHDEAKR